MAWLGSGKDRGLGLRVDLVNRLGPLSQPSVFWVQPFQVMDIPQGLTSRFSYGFPIFWVQLPLLLPLRFFPVSVPDITPVEAASLHTPL